MYILTGERVVRCDRPAGGYLHVELAAKTILRMRFWDERGRWYTEVLDEPSWNISTLWGAAELWERSGEILGPLPVWETQQRFDSESLLFIGPNSERARVGILSLGSESKLITLGFRCLLDERPGYVPPDMKLRTITGHYFLPGSDDTLILPSPIFGLEASDRKPAEVSLAASIADARASLSALIDVSIDPGEHGQRGHNNPPDLLPMTAEDRIIVENSLAVFEQASAVQATDRQAVIRLVRDAAQALLHLLQKLMAWLGKHVDGFTGEFAKSAGKSLGTPAGIALASIAFSGNLQAVIDAVLGFFF